MKTIILFSSANKQGNTAQAIAALEVDHAVDLIDIDQLSISPFNYQSDYPNDDFYPLVEKILNAQNIVFASPVYWHSVTAPMKALIDRMTELLEVPEFKPKARALASKRAFVLASSASPELCPIFSGFFERLFAYFNMEFGGALHAASRDGFYVDPQQLAQFSAKLNQA
ncbi:flavodoxin family protein [Vibrio sp. LaRot3]|uniref:flavodoxin family protein n=1 Tax=Vibrio sp. LaRot3 TaxID=2998829 RepID=UPI0022CDFE40|nr:NAD(P)H-dependent oxidoreductase [Vibrio sp. LaRot3]MDA0149781.1 NAD(P)H-dependent oxidoreductase [Vibrio sp. LaRot3]